MNRALPFQPPVTTLLTVIALLAISRAHAAPTNPPPDKATTNAVTTPAAKTATTNAAPAEIPIPQSVFIIPRSASEGVDPFYPLTTRFKPVVNLNNSTNRATVVADLVIKGFSGTPTFPFVIINNATFAVGDDKEVSTPQGRVRVRCLEIRLKDESALVEANGERRELRFRAGK